MKRTSSTFDNIPKLLSQSLPIQYQKQDEFESNTLYNYFLNVVGPVICDD
jgi:hypothetical protein